MNSITFIKYKKKMKQFSDLENSKIKKVIDDQYIYYCVDCESVQDKKDKCYCYRNKTFEEYKTELFIDRIFNKLLISN